MNNVNNYCIAVKEKGDDIVFLRKIVKGGADKSYGIQVAKLAGVPDMVIDRAKEIVIQLCDNDILEKVQSIAIDQKETKHKAVKYDEVDLSQMSLFDTVTDEDVLNELKELDVSTLTPLDALNTIYRLQNKLKNRWQEVSIGSYSSLSQNTIDQIAAGEVVERPRSVVKELTENAIDAGATAISVEIKEGGISLIRVTDNGSGIEKSQIRKAFLRHATSKIEDAQDLPHIQSLGFRGEALSSICAVSQMELITKTQEDFTGIHYQIEGGAECEFSEIGAPKGTTFLVRNLFYNVPARRKFLKQPQTEGSYVADLMEHLALSHPDISIKFIVNGQVRFQTSGNNQLKEVIYRIYGKEVTDHLIEFSLNGKSVRVRGFWESRSRTVPTGILKFSL